MKRILTLLSLLAVALQLSAQAPAMERRPLWVGLDMGGTWQASDMKAQGGIGWSFTLSRYSRLSKTGPLYWGWRFRFLDGRNFGYNYHALSGLTADPTYNTPTLATYYSEGNDTSYMFSNYRFRFDEFAFEFIVGSNTLRQHGVLLYAFGGPGLTHWRTTTDQLDESGQKYDYSAIDKGGNDDVVKGELNALWGQKPFRNYETVTYKGGSQWGFMPSAGIGIGYQWKNYVAIGVEHRTTWALNDNIDGVAHNYSGAKTPNNDLYNYDGFFVRWTFGGGGSHSSDHNTPPPPPNPNSYTQNPTQNPTTSPGQTTTTVTQPQNPNPGTGGSQAPTIPAPYVRFTTPATDPYTTNVQNQQLVVRVDNVSYSSQIQLVINNQVVNSFSFNPNTHTMVFSHVLIPGTNVYTVTATTQGGTASDVQTIIYQQEVTTTVQDPGPSQLPPQVTITNPPSDPYTSAVQSMNVSATVLNVATAANIQVRDNGNPVNNFAFNPNTHQVTFTANLVNGNNLYEVIGTNNVGSASDAVTIIYSTAPAMQPPVVTITSPATCPFTTKTVPVTISANITNVTTASQVHITFNNQAVTNFNFTPHGSSASVSFTESALNPNSNPFSITGTNTAGSDTKSCDIIYKVSTPNVPPPTVTITTPSSSPYTSPTQMMTLYATVLNVAGQNEIHCTFNNANVTGFSYNMSTHVLTYNASLNPGNNVFVVNAANNNGSDTKSTTIIYNSIPVPPPTVNITNPSSDPYTTSVSVANVTATVMNATSSQITVTGPNAASINFSFNSTTHIVSFTANLVAGSNLYTVTATNAAGTASDHTTINYVQSGNVGGDGGVLPHTSRPTDDPNAPGQTSQGSGGQTGSVSISLSVPATATSTASSNPTQVTMICAGVTSASEVTVTVNSVAVTNFNYNAFSHAVTFNASLNQGANTIVVHAQNSSGSDTKTITINFGTSNNRQSGGGSGTAQPSRSGGSSGSGGSSHSSTTTQPKAETPKSDPPKAETQPSRGGSSTTTTPSSGTPRGGETHTSSSATKPR